MAPPAETDQRGLYAAAELIRQSTPFLAEARLNEVGAAEIGYRLTVVCKVGVILGDRMDRAQADASLWHELQGCAAMARDKLSDWALVGPSRQGAVLSFLLGPGCCDARGVLTSRAGRFRQLRSLWRYPKDVPCLLLEFDRDNLGRLSPELAERRQREATLWNSETPMVQTLKARQDTFLKKAPIAHSYLSSTGKVAVSAGTVIRFDQIQDLAADAHGLVTLVDQAGQWYIFTPHFESETPVAPAKGRITTVDWMDLNAPVGRHFTVGEVLRNDLRRRPTAGSPEEANILGVVREADAIRESWSAGILITSGYRPEPYNRQVGGVPDSRHVAGDALDICPADGDLNGFYQWLKVRWSGALGDGRRKGFLHIDRRNGGGFHPKAGVAPCVIWDYCS